MLSLLVCAVNIGIHLIWTVASLNEGGWSSPHSIIAVCVFDFEQFSSLAAHLITKPTVSKALVFWIPCNRPFQPFICKLLHHVLWLMWTWANSWPHKPSQSVQSKP